MQKLKQWSLSSQFIWLEAEYIHCPMYKLNSFYFYHLKQTGKVFIIYVVENLKSFGPKPSEYL